MASEREKLRSETTDLQQRLRNEPGVPQTLFELIDVVVRRLDRIELGAFESEDEKPTSPERRVSSGTLTVTKPLAERIGDIFDTAKGKKEKGE